MPRSTAQMSVFVAPSTLASMKAGDGAVVHPLAEVQIALSPALCVWPAVGIEKEITRDAMIATNAENLLAETKFSVVCIPLSSPTNLNCVITRLNPGLRRDLKHCPAITVDTARSGATVQGRAIDIPGLIENQRSRGLRAVGVTSKCVQNVESPRFPAPRWRSHSEHVTLS